MSKKTKRHLISLSDLSKNDMDQIVSRSVAFANGEATADNLLSGQVIGIYFRKTSTRTRTSFSTAALKMGAQIIAYGPQDLQENTGETIEDTKEVLSRMLDGLVARTAGSCEEMRCFASQDRMGVINAMTEKEHPTQAFADLTTIKQQFGDISGLKILYVGEGNNTATALALSIPQYDNTELIFCTPDGYGLDSDILEKARRYATLSGSNVKEIHSLEGIASEVDIIYTTRWQTTGTSKPDPNWRDLFVPFRVTQDLMDKYPKAVFMHDLPAHRGEEVEKAVIDGSASIALNQVENKLHSAKAILEWCLQ